MADKKDEFLEEAEVEETSEEEETAEEEVKKIKIGDEEYTEDELKELVSLGKIGKEAEEKYQTKIDRVWPEFTKKSQRLKELEEKIAKREEEVAKTKLAVGQELSPEEQRRIAREEARKLGILLDEDFDRLYQERRQAERLIEEAEDMVLEAQEKYGIKTTVKELLEHMAKPESPKNVEKAFKDMFEEQIEAWKEKQLAKRKGAELVTETASTAGAKEPKKPKLTRENIREAVAEALRGG